MSKTKEELSTLKQEYDALTNKLKELNDDELSQVTGGCLTLKPGEVIDIIGSLKASESAKAEVTVR